MKRPAIGATASRTATRRAGSPPSAASCGRSGVPGQGELTGRIDEGVVHVAVGNFGDYFRAVNGLAQRGGPVGPTCGRLHRRYDQGPEHPSRCRRDWHAPCGQRRQLHVRARSTYDVQLPRQGRPRRGAGQDGMAQGNRACTDRRSSYANLPSRGRDCDSGGRPFATHSGS